MLPEGIYNTPAMEAWLSDQARRGRWVQRLSGYRAVFQEGAPGECRFRLEPRMDRPERPDGEALYGEMGWEYVTACREEPYLWRAGRAGAPHRPGGPGHGLRRPRPHPEAPDLWHTGRAVPGPAGVCLLIRPDGVLTLAQDGFSVASFSLFAMLWSTGVLLFDMRMLRILRRTLGADITPERTAPRAGRRAANSCPVVFPGIWGTVLLIDCMGRGETMDAFEQSASVYALAVTLAKSMNTEELTRTALLLTQLGTTLATLAGLQNLNQSSSAQELADLSGLR